jgi:hypothetical protein
MTPPEQFRWPLERCWVCAGWIFRDDATRELPGFGLIVHAHCYESADPPVTRRPPDAA